MTPKHSSENTREVLTLGNKPFSRQGEHGKTKSTTLGVRVPIPLKRKFKAKAEEAGKTTQAILEKFIIDYVNDGGELV